MCVCVCVGGGGGGGINYYFRGIFQGGEGSNDSRRGEFPPKLNPAVAALIRSALIRTATGSYTRRSTTKWVGAVG